MTPKDLKTNVYIDGFKVNILKSGITAEGHIALVVAPAGEEGNPLAIVMAGPAFDELAENVRFYRREVAARDRAN